MTQLWQFLQDYQPRDQREGIIVEILLEGQRLQSLAVDINPGDRPYRRWQFQWKKWRSQLITQVFYQLPALSRPRREVREQYREEYDSLCNEVAAEFVEHILTEFDPYLVTQGKSLTAKLTIWINSKLRLKWRILDLVMPQQKTKEMALLELILDLAWRSPNGFTKGDFLAAIKPQQQFETQWAREFLLELLPQFWSAAPEGDRYFLDQDRLQNHVNQLSEQLYISPLDPAIASQIPDFTNIPKPPKTPTLSQKITRLLSEQRQTLNKICLKNNPQCHCMLLLENYFQEQLYQIDINEENIVRLLGIKRPTYQSHLERKCLPAFWEFVIETSPVSQMSPQSQTIPLKYYIEKDPILLLQKCYYSDKNQQDYFDCNCKNLAEKILEFFTPKPAKWNHLAALYALTNDTLIRFWKMKCLFLLSLIVFELESEYSDRLDIS